MWPRPGKNSEITGYFHLSFTPKYGPIFILFLKNSFFLLRTQIIKIFRNYHGKNVDQNDPYFVEMILHITLVSNLKALL